MDSITICETCGAICQDGKPVGDETLAALMDSVEFIFPSRFMGSLEISTRAKYALRNGDIERLGQLIKKTKKELLTMRGMGKVSVREIEAALAKRGMKLASKTP